MAQELTPSVAWGFVDALDYGPAPKVSQDAIATVSRRDADGVVWVTFDGSTADTPVSTVLQAVSVGERCRVSIHGGRVTIVGNSTSPGVGLGQVDEAITPTKRVAETSISLAREAKLAANSAVSDAGIAKSAAESATRDAATANDAAMRAVEDANTAHIAANEAKQSAAEAKEDAAEAKASATRANSAANDALAQLSFVEDVAGTLDWIQSHGTFAATTDTEVEEGTVYFELVSGDYVPVVPTGDEDPSAEGWYVLDTTESQSDYIMAHLAVTAAGLWVLPSGIGGASTPQGAAGYKMLLASDGAYLYDGDGHLVTTYGESITFDSSRPQTIGGEDAYIAYYDTDDDGVPDSIYIGGANVSIGGKSASELLTSLDVSATQTATGADITVNGSTVHLSNGQDGATGPQGPAGTSVTVSSVAYAYQLSTSGTTPPTGTWQSTPQAPTTTQFCWTRTIVTFSDGSKATTYAVGGKVGTNGTSPTVTSSKTQWQLSTSGTQVPTGTWSDSALAPTTTQYAWTRTTYTYSDGTTATSYAVGGKVGEKGDTGVGLTSIAEQWYLSTSEEEPTGGEWSGDQPAWSEGRHIWSRYLVTWDDGTTETTTPTLASALNSASAAAATAQQTADQANAGLAGKADAGVLETLGGTLSSFMTESAANWDDVHDNYATLAKLDEYVSKETYDSGMDSLGDQLKLYVSRDEVWTDPGGDEAGEWAWETLVRLTEDSIQSSVSQTYATKADTEQTRTLAGTVVTAGDALAAPPRGLTAYGSSTQDGTPTPEAPVAIESVDELALWVAPGVLDEPDQSAGTPTAIDLQGHELRSLPDGTRDELAVDARGNVTLTQLVGVTTTATTDGIVATVGTDAMSTTGDLSDGATVIYGLATPQTIGLGTVELPTLPAPEFSAWTADATDLGLEYWRTAGELAYESASGIISLSSTVTQQADSISTLIEGTNQLSTMVRQYYDGVLVCKTDQTIGALVNADGSFDVVPVEWDGLTPTAGDPITSIGGDHSYFGSTSGFRVAIETVGTGDDEHQQLSFYDASNDLVAYMYGGLMYVENTMVLRTMRVGEDDPSTAEVEGWEWAYQSNGNLTLKWIG